MSLIERLEAAEVGSRELDAAIWYALIETCGGKPDRDMIDRWPAYTTSLDAALALAERVLPGCCPGVSQNVHSGVWFSWLGYSDEGVPRLYADAFGKTAAVSVCIAILKAKETK